MDWLYGLLSSALSLSAAAILLPLLHRMRTSVVFSAALGIIVFQCVKSIFAECGWGFASIFGVFGGAAVQTLTFAAAFLFFCELTKGTSDGERRIRLSDDCTVLLLGAGGNFMHDYRELTDIAAYLTGEAIGFTMLMLSVAALREEGGEKEPASHMNRFAFLTMLRGGMLLLCRATLTAFDRSFAGLILMTLGTAGAVCAFTRSLRRGREISTGSFAAGLTAAFCFGVLTE